VTVPQHIVELRVGNVIVDTWESYRITHDMQSPADSFDMTFGVAGWDPQIETAPIVEQLREAARAFEPVELVIDGALQLTGYIDTINGTGSESGPRLRLIGRDVGGQVVDEPMPKGFNALNMTLTNILGVILGKWNIPIDIGNEGNRKLCSTKKIKHQFKESEKAQAQQEKWYKKVEPTLERWHIGYATKEGIITEPYLRGYETVILNRKVQKELKPKNTDTRWDFLQRVLKTQNLYGWFSADGHFVVASPNYDQDPLFHVTNVVENPDAPAPARDTSQNNVEEGVIVENPGKRYSAVYVFGRQGKDPIRAEAHDDVLEALGVERPWYHRDKAIKTIEEAQRVADRILWEGQNKGSMATYTLTGHGQGDRLYAFDTVFDVHDDEPSRWVHDTLYCTVVTQRYDLEAGPRTQVRLQPKGIIEVPTS